MQGFANRIEGIIGAAVRSFKTAGALRTVQRLFQRTIPQTLFDINVLIAIEQPLELWRDQFPNDLWQHRWATAEDMDELVAGGPSRKDVQSYLDAGGRPAITSKDGEFAGVVWPIPGKHDCFGWLRVVPEPGEIMGGPAYVVPKYRGQRCHLEARKFAYPQLLRDGYQKLLGFIQLANRSSLRVNASLERRYVGRIFYIRILGFVIYRIDRKWGAGFWNEARPYELSFEVFDREGPSRPPKAAYSKYKGPRNT